MPNPNPGGKRPKRVYNKNYKPRVRPPAPTGVGGAVAAKHGLETTLHLRAVWKVYIILGIGAGAYWLADKLMDDSDDSDED